VSGQYAPVVSDFLFLNLTLAYDPNNVYLDIVRNDITFPDAARTPNQKAVAGAAQNLPMDDPVVAAILNLTSDEEAQQAFDSLSGEIYASTLSVLTEDSRYLREAVLNRLQTLTPPKHSLLAHFDPSLVQHSAPGFDFWAQGFGAWGNLAGNYNTSKVNRSTKGLFLGADSTVNEALRLGIVGGYSHADFEAKALISASKADSYSLGGYGGMQLQPWSFYAGAAYTWNNINTQRNAAFSDFNNYLTTDYSANTTQVFAELVYDLPVFYRFAFSPFANAAYVSVNRDGFNEQGGPAALQGQYAKENVAYTTLGFREAARLYSSEVASFNERVLLGWRYAYNHINPTSIFAFLSGSPPFLISGVPIARNSLIIDAGTDVDFKNKNLSLRLAYIGQVAQKVEDNGFAVTLTWQFS
jgi:outer membrane autotransporter protein